MTDRYTELVRTAYEAQQAREGDGYVKLTTELTAIDADLEALSAKRETAVAALEAMDEAVEAAKEALDAYFAGREEGDELHPDAEPMDTDGLYEGGLPVGSKAWDEYRDVLFEPDYRAPSSEFESAKANGALTD